MVLVVGVGNMGAGAGIGAATVGGEGVEEPHDDGSWTDDLRERRSRGSRQARQGCVEGNLGPAKPDIRQRLPAVLSVGGLAMGNLSAERTRELGMQLRWEIIP